MYGIIIFSISLLCVYIAYKFSRNKSIPENDFWKFTFWVFFFGIVGARIYHVVDYIDYYKGNIPQIVMIYKGGLSILGAIIGSGAYLLITNNPFKELLMDIGALILPVGQIVGRMGNYFNNELLGVNNTPLFFYEMMLNFLLLLILIKRKHGGLFYIYLIGYGTIRILLEPLHVEFNLTNFLVCTCFIIFGMVKLKQYESEKKA